MSDVNERIRIMAKRHNQQMASREAEIRALEAQVKELVEACEEARKHIQQGKTACWVVTLVQIDEAIANAQGGTP